MKNIHYVNQICVVNDFFNFYIYKKLYIQCFVETIKDNEIFNDGALSIAKKLTLNSNLTKIELSSTNERAKTKTKNYLFILFILKGCDIDVVGIKFICNSLGKTKNLKYIDLKSNYNFTKF